MDLVASVYAETEEFSRRELYSLTGQIRRAAVSIPINLSRILSGLIGSLLEKIGQTTTPVDRH